MIDSLYREEVIISLSALLSSNSCTVFLCPFSLAAYKGVVTYFKHKFISAPCLSKSFTKNVIISSLTSYIERTGSIFSTFFHLFSANILLFYSALIHFHNTVGILQFLWYHCRLLKLKDSIRRLLSVI